MSRTPLVFVPGMMCDQRLFAPQVAALGAKRDIRIADCTQDHTIAGMAHRLLREAPPRFALTGLSMGGIVAFEVYRQAADRIAGLALLNTTPHADAPTNRPIRLAQLKRVREGELREVVLDELKPNYLSPVNKPDQALLDVIYAMAAELGAGVFERQTEALMGRADSKPVLPQIACPTVIIAGQDDTVCPPRLHELMYRAIPAADYSEIPQCGHLSTLEASEAVTRLLARLLDTIDQR